nr:hypothetical protein [Tanacetum cinerariifolium]
MQEFWATAKLHHNSIHFKMDTKKSVLDLEEFREMLHISLRIPSQSFAELLSEEEILDFLSLPSRDETELIGITLEMMFCSLQSRWYRDTRQLKNMVLYYRLSSLLMKSGTVSLTRSTMLVQRERQEMHISQQRGSGIDKGTGSKPGVPDVPSDASEEELSWNSSDDEEVGEQTKETKESERDKSDESDDECDEGSDDDNEDDDDNDDDDNDEEEELAKKDDEDTETGKGSDEVSESEG